MDKIATLYDAAGKTGDAAVLPTVTTSSAVKAVAAVDSPSKQSYIGAKNLSKFSNEAHVYGLTSGNGKVALANTDILSVSVDNSNDFVADLRDNYYSTATVGVYAKDTLSSTKPTASGNLSVTIKSADGLVHTVSTAISSKDDTPVAASVGITVDKADASDSNNNQYASPYYHDMTVVGNNVTMSAADFYKYVAAGAGSASNGIMSKYDATGAHGTTSLVYFYAKDQYGTSTAPFTSWNMAVKDSSQKDITATSGLTLSGNTLTASSQALTNGSTITITGVTSNGLVQSINIVIDNSKQAD